MVALVGGTAKEIWGLEAVRRSLGICVQTFIQKLDLAFQKGKMLKLVGEPQPYSVRLQTTKQL